MPDRQIINFALYNGLGVAAFIVFVLYVVFAFSKLAKREYDWSVEFAVGIIIATLSKLIERTYYGIARAMNIYTGETHGVPSDSIIISIIALIGITGFVWHTKTLSKAHFKHGFWKGAAWVILGTILSSLFWAQLYAP